MEAMLFKRDFSNEVEWAAGGCGTGRTVRFRSQGPDRPKSQMGSDRRRNGPNLGTSWRIFLALREHLQNKHSRFLWRRRFLFRCSRHNAAWIRRGGWPPDGL